MGGAEFPVRAILDDKGIEQLIAQLTKAGKQAGLTEKEIQDINNQVRNVGRNAPQEINKVNKSFDSLNTKVSNGAKLLLTYFAIDRLKAFGKEVFNVTAEFQKLFAVLENTLGSRGLARAAFIDITEFASKTPFQVNEITDAFVRLANRGFVPTREQLRQIGDLAASQGKSFTQLVEAILDGQTLEFERLKEFGIKAKQTNDSVIFSFKGVRTEVARNEEAILKYLLSLGDVEGVMGGMEAVSRTLGGQMSNLTDSFDRLFAALGESSTGILSFVLRQLGTAVDWAREIIEGANSLADPFADDRAKAIKQAADDFDRLTKDDKAKAINKIAEEVQEWRRRMNELTSAYAALSAESGTLEEKMQNAADILGLSMEDAFDILENYNFELLLTQSNLTEVEEIFKIYMDRWQKLAEPGGPTARHLGMIEQLEKKLKDLKERREQAFSEDDIFLINNEIRRTQEELKKLEGLGFDPLTESVKDLNLELVNLDKLAAKAFNNFERSLKKFQEGYKEQQKEEADAAAAREEAQLYARDTQIAAMQSVLDFRAQAVEQEIQMLEYQRQREIENAGNNEDAKIAINKKYDAQRAELMRKQAAREQQAAIFGILINQGPAIAKTIANIGMPWALPFIGAVATILGLQLTNTRGAAPPRFKDGVFKLKGPGSETSDSIPAYLSKNESVVSAGRTSKYGSVVRALVEGTDADVKRAMAMQLRGDLFQLGGDAGAATELKEVNSNLQKLLSKETFHLGIDENGFLKWTQKGNYITHIMGRRYRS